MKIYTKALNEYLQLLHQLYPGKGGVVLAYLFAIAYKEQLTNQINQPLSFFPKLKIIGPPASGKSTLYKSLRGYANDAADLQNLSTLINISQGFEDNNERAIVLKLSFPNYQETKEAHHDFQKFGSHYYQPQIFQYIKAFERTVDKDFILIYKANLKLIKKNFKNIDPYQQQHHCLLITMLFLLGPEMGLDADKLETDCLKNMLKTNFLFINQTV